MAEPIPSTPQRKPAATSAPNTGPSPVKPGPASVPTDVSLAQQKQVMLDDLQEKVPQVDWEFFEDNILPPLPHKIDVDSVVTKLVKKQAVTMVEGEYRWTQFALGSPKDYNGHEDAIFANMSKIVSAIKGVASSAKAKRLFKCKPRTTPVSGTRDNNTRPDAYYLRNDAAVKDPIPRWTNIIIPAEFKIKDDPSSENTNWAQILWSLNHLMREDPTRRFALGFTIEGTKMRLWFASRSDVLVSLPVNFVTSVRHVVGFFLRVMFAEDHQLGFDDTIVPRPTLDSTGGVQYDIEVNGTWYRTQRLVSSIGAETIRGRGTRVWEVKELDANKVEKSDSSILKDSWGDEKRLREELVNKKIRDTKNLDDSQSEMLQQSLLTCLNSWDVTVETLWGRKPDSTRKVMLRGQDAKHRGTVNVKKNLDASKRVAPKLPAKGTLSQGATIEPQHIRYGEKIHHRIVFAEVGITIQEVGSLYEAFQYLAQVALELYDLHSAGWVHRDISVGNIIIHEQHAKLADIEYAKEETDDTRHDVRTGTVFFMAAEVDDGGYLLLRKPRHTELKSIPEGMASAAKRAEMVAQFRKWDPFKPRSGGTEGSTRNPAPQPLDTKTNPQGAVFKHNPLHDLESVFWLAVFLVLCTILQRPVDTPEDDWKEYIAAHDTLSALLFHDKATRLRVVTQDWAFEEQLIGLHPRILAICEELDRVRSVLTEAYSRAESDPSNLTFERIMSIELTLPGDPETEASLPLHLQFVKVFRSIALTYLDGNDDIKFDKRPSLSEQRQLMEAALTKAAAEKTKSEGVRTVGNNESAQVLNESAQTKSLLYKMKLRRPGRGAVTDGAVGM